MTGNDGDNYSFSSEVHGQQQINVGQKGGKAEQNYYASSGGLTVEEFFDGLETVLKELNESKQQVVRTEAVVPLREAAVAEQKAAKEADVAPAVPPEKRESFMKKYGAKLIPYAPLIARCVAAFTEASLKSLVESNWVVAGVVAIAGEVKRGV